MPSTARSSDNGGPGATAPGCCPLLACPGRWFYWRRRSRRGAAPYDDDQTTGVRDGGLHGADDGRTGRRQMEPLPACVIGQGDEFGELLHRRIKRQDNGERADSDSPSYPACHRRSCSVRSRHEPGVLNGPRDAPDRTTSDSSRRLLRPTKSAQPGRRSLSHPRRPRRWAGGDHTSTPSGLLGSGHVRDRNGGSMTTRDRGCR